MGKLVIASLTLAILAGCGARQGGGTMATADAGAQQAAIDEVSRIAAEHCATGVHGSMDHVATDGPLLIVGTAGEIIEGRASLDEVNQSYSTRDVEVRHDCEGAQRLAYAAAAGNVVWLEEALRTHASWPGFSVDFPSQRTMIFERLPEGWRLRYYSLSVRLPDDQLDEAYAQPADGAAGAAADPAAAAATAE
jgi:hypothetical protein